MQTIQILFPALIVFLLTAVFSLVAFVWKFRNKSMEVRMEDLTTEVRKQLAEKEKLWIELFKISSLDNKEIKQSISDLEKTLSGLTSRLEGALERVDTKIDGFIKVCEVRHSEDR